jgi:hypothetical protein
MSRRSTVYGVTSWSDSCAMRTNTGGDSAMRSVREAIKFHGLEARSISL